MLKTKKNRKNLFLIAKLILFAGVVYVLYSQISQFEADAWDTFELKNPLAAVLAVLLVYPNLWLAFLKWKLILKAIGISSDRKQRVQSFFAGIVTGMLTPNMIGNFIGRFYYFDRSKRGMITAFTMFGNYAQFLASMTFGTVAVFGLGELLVLEENKNVIIWLIIGVVVAYLVYYFIDNFLGLLRKREFVTEFREQLDQHKWFRTTVLFVSFLRFLIFTLQFSLMLHAFGAELSLDLIAAIWQVYLLTIIAPSLFLGKIGVKESIALFVLSGTGLNDFSILFSSLLIWFINSMSPALIGLIVCKDRPK